MIKVLFVCLGNICRSPMMEFMFKDMLKKRGIEDKFYVESAGTSSEEKGNPVHVGARRKLEQYGINCDGKTARKLTKEDYDNFDYIIAAEESNIYDMEYIFGRDKFVPRGENKQLNKLFAFKREILRDKNGKVHKLLDFTNYPRDISDPWYHGNFDATYDDIKEGLIAFLEKIEEV